MVNDGNKEMPTFFRYFHDLCGLPFGQNQFQFPISGAANGPRPITWLTSAGAPL